jgi:hypothetical protein
MPPLGNIRYFGLESYVRMFIACMAIKLHDLIWKTETKSAEISFGLIAIGWWIVLCVSPIFDIRNLYAYLEVAATQNVWAWFMLVLGTAQLALSIAPQDKLRLFRASVWASSTIVWSYVAFVAMLAVPISTALAAYGVLGLGSAWAFLRSIEN